MLLKLPKGIKNIWPELGFWLVFLLYCEALLHAVVYDSFGSSFVYVAGFSLALALGVAALLSFLPDKVRGAVSLVLSVLVMVFYGSQVVYYFVFGGVYSASLLTQGGQAVTNFWRETLSTMLDHWLSLALLALPVAAAFLLRRAIWASHPRSRWQSPLLMLVLAVLAMLGTEQIIKAGGTGAFSDYDYYTSAAVATDQNVERFGLVTTFRLEMLGGEEADAEPEFFVPETVPVQTQPRAEAPEEEEKPVEYNVLPIDFAALNDMTESTRIRALNDYCAQLAGTQKNEYTGMLADYNLILLCGESFSTGAIHPEITPTLYKLANEGIIFNNYYNSFANVTANGEYALLQGLFPDVSRGKQESSLLASRKNFLPFTPGNAFGRLLGREPWGYHNFYRTSYGRNETHPNMGYYMQFAQSGMEFTDYWPYSDLQMMEQSVDDYIGETQFHAYYMTFSGHYQYKTSVNSIAERNWDLVKDLPYSCEAIKAYMACNIELDRALGYLMERLEEAGIAERTAIVMAGDHIPYGLQDKEYSELIGYETDRFSKFKSTLIFWVGGLEENIVVDEYCCNVDVLPTILNLWGLDYDSRLLAGTDVFSDGEHAAVLFSKSWLTDKVWFDTNKGEAVYLVDESEVPEGYVDTMNAKIANRFQVSTNILNTNYYNFVFENSPELSDMIN